MAIAQPKMHTLTLSTKQLEEVFDLVAISLTDIQEDLSKAKGLDKTHLTMSLVFYEAIYAQCEKALQE